MEKAYLDANKFIDIVTMRRKFDVADEFDPDLLTSILNLHILAYILKLKRSELRTVLSLISNNISVIGITSEIAQMALNGPTEK